MDNSDSAFQFIIESPQNSTGHKKRPRLVTSCDNCRLKKIKCLQPAPEAKCDACRAAKIQCRFKDRERYFAERSRAIAGPNAGGDSGTGYNNAPALDAFSVAPPPTSSSRTPLRQHPPSTTTFQNDPPQEDSQYHRHHPSWDSSNNSNSNSTSYPPSSYPPPAAPPQQPPPSSTPPVPLFEPRSQYPYATLMPHFIQVFFERMGSEFPFLSHESILRDHWEHRLSPMMACSIAAMAARYTTIPDITSRGTIPVVDAYAENAKRIFNSIAHTPSVDTLLALIVLCWSEFKSIRSTSNYDPARQADFRTYCQLAYRMAIDVGWTDQAIASLNLDDAEKTKRRTTWAQVGQLQMTANAPFR